MRTLHLPIWSTQGNTHVAGEVMMVVYERKVGGPRQEFSEAKSRSSHLMGKRDEEQPDSDSSHTHQTNPAA